MCQACLGLQRRTLLKTAAFGLAAAGLGLPVPASRAAGSGTTLTSDQALHNLKEGNDKYVANAQACAQNLSVSRSSLATSQAPWAIIVSCSDSRLPPELVFGGLGLGELFVIRNAGNMVDVAAMGTIEYGVAALHAPLIVVLGHERCGAVEAACKIVSQGASYPGSIFPMAAAIAPAAMKTLTKRQAAAATKFNQAIAEARYGDADPSSLDITKNFDAYLDDTVRESARMTAERLTASSQIIKEQVAAGKLKVVSARYDLDSGKVDYL